MNNHTVNAVNWLNIAIAVIALVQIGFLLLGTFGNPKQIRLDMSAQYQGKSTGNEFKVSKKSKEYYERILSRRKLFVAQPGVKQRTEAKASLQQLGFGAADLQLLGVVSGVNGPQAIISESSSGKTIYCNLNDSVNGFVVVEILSKKVILDFNGERLELHL